MEYLLRRRATAKLRPSSSKTCRLATDMLKQRLKYGSVTGIIIIAGLLSRKFSIIPLWVGDVLWAAMICFILRFFYPRAPAITIAFGSVTISFAIEFSQLYKAPWIDDLRHTFFGRMVLGDTFLWGDLLSYSVGILLAVLLDHSLNKKIR